MACRGETLADNKPSYYTVLTQSIDACKQSCRDTAGCVGIESIGTRCEIWTRPEGIKVGKALAGYTCLRYHGGLPTAPSTKQERDARFLIQATFGPTRASLAELGNFSDYDSWIAHQMALPPSLLRVYYRQRANPRPVMSASDMDSGSPKSRCAAGPEFESGKQTEHVSYSMLLDGTMACMQCDCKIQKGLNLQMNKGTCLDIISCVLSYLT